MPQFDFYSFSGQNFWILLSFFLFYFFTVYFYLTSFSEMFKMRQKLISFYTSENKDSNSSLLNLFDFFISIKTSKL
jgi:F0F1-type ATP synthase membrane subunit b/b'